MIWLFLLFVVAPVVLVLLATYALLRLTMFFGVAIFALTLLLTQTLCGRAVPPAR
jgi:hypothetical protein